MDFTRDTARRLSVEEINRRMTEDPVAFVEEECARYRQEVADAAAWLNNENVRRRILLLSGPSSSGKTSTANLLCDNLRAAGVDAYVVSLDDFYLGRGIAPRLPDGSYDYESPEALNLPFLARCVCELLETGHTFLPIYDFKAGKPRDELQEMTLKNRSVVIFEGIHALHPSLREQLPKKHVKRMFIQAQSIFCVDGEELLSQREIRICRRTVRDERHRGSSAAETLAMWPQVVYGEEHYLFPYAPTADVVIDTTHAFEPCLFAKRVLPLLNTVPADHPGSAIARELEGDMAHFVPAPVSLLPADSILHEFLD